VWFERGVRPEGVIDHYAAGGRTITTGPNAGVGTTNPNKSEFINGFVLTPDERATGLIKLIDTGALPHRKVGRHRRIRMEDVMAYKARIDAERESILDELAADAQEQGMGYETL